MAESMEHGPGREHGAESMVLRAWQQEHGGGDHGGESMVVGEYGAESMAARALARIGNHVKSPWHIDESMALRAWRREHSLESIVMRAWP